MQYILHTKKTQNNLGLFKSSMYNINMETLEDYLGFFKKYRKELLVLLFLGVMVGGFYGNTLLNGFIHDDHGQITQNIYIQK